MATTPNKLKKFELTTGVHNEEYYPKCSGCIRKGVMEANTPKTIVLSITRFDDVGNRAITLCYCMACFPVYLKELEKEVEHDYFVSGQDSKFKDYFNEKPSNINNK